MGMIRINDEIIHEALRARAKRNRRSDASELTVILEAYFEKPVPSPIGEATEEPRVVLDSEEIPNLGDLI